MTVETKHKNALISVTEQAAKHLKKQLKNESDQYIRISVKKSGCTGYAYVLDTVAEAEASDFIKKVDDDLTIYISSEAESMLVGTEVDLKVEGLNREIQFNNPNVTDTCGCGASFSVS